MVNKLPDNNLEPTPVASVENKKNDGIGKFARNYGRAIVLVVGGVISNSANALDIHGENDFDADYGTNYTDVGSGTSVDFVPHNFTSNGVGFKTIYDSDSEVSTLYITTDGVAFTDVTSLLASAESGMSEFLGLCDYSGNFDQLMVSSNDHIFIFEGIGNTGTVTNSFELETLYALSSCGGIDEETGEFYIIDGGLWGETLHAYKATESAEPTEYYDYNESDDMVSFQANSIDDQGAFWNRDDSDQIYWIDGVSAGTGNATATGFYGGIYGYYSNSETGSYPIIIHHNRETDLIEYMYDLDSPAPVEYEDLNDLTPGTALVTGETYTNEDGALTVTSGSPTYTGTNESTGNPTINFVDGDSIIVENLTFDFESTHVGAISGTARDYDAAMSTGIEFVGPPDDDPYPYSDTDDLSQMFHIDSTDDSSSNDDELHVVGQYDLDVSFTGPINEYFADIYDENTDTGENTDTARDTGLNTDDTGTDTNSNDDTNSAVDSRNSDTSGENTTEDKEGGCNGCNSTNGNDVNLIASAVTLASLIALRRKQQK